MTQVCVGNSGCTGAFHPKFFLEVVFACAQIEHHMFNVQLFEQCFVRNSSLSPPPLFVHSLFSPSLLHSSPWANAYHLLPTCSTSRHLTQDAILSRPISPRSLAHHFSLLSPRSSLPLSPSSPLSPLHPLSPSSLISSPFRSRSVLLTLPLALRASLNLPPSPFRVASPLVLLTRGILCFSRPPPPRVTLQPLHHPHSPQAFTHIHACAAAQAN